MFFLFSHTTTTTTTADTGSITILHIGLSPEVFARFMEQTNASSLRKIVKERGKIDLMK